MGALQGFVRAGGRVGVVLLAVACGGGGGGGDDGADGGTQGGDLLDTDFGEDGVLRLPSSWSNDRILALSRDQDGSLFVGGSSDSVGFRNDGLVAKFTASGALDATFGRRGYAVLGVHDMLSVTGVEAAGDGSVYAAGFSFYGTDSFTFLAHVRGDGTLDPDFGNEGYVLWETRGRASVRLARATTGALFVVNEANGGADIELRKFSAAGVLDTSFGSGGIVNLSGDAPRDLLLGPGGTIYVLTQNSSTATLRRLTASGSLDPTFAGGAPYVVPFSMEAYDLALSADGNELLIGGSGDQGKLVKLDGDGSVVTGFGTDGVVSIAMQEDLIQVHWLPTGELLVVDAYASNFPNSSFQAIHRLDASGALSTFDDTVSRQARGYSTAPLLVNGDGIILASSARSADTAGPAGGAVETLVVAMNVDGTPQTTFGDNGSVRAGSGVSSELIWDTAKHPDGSLSAVGVAGYHGILMHVAGGSFDTAYGEAGFAPSAPPAVQLQGGCFADAQGRVVAAGIGLQVARYTADGSADTTFGGNGNGAMALNPGTGGFVAGVAVDATGRIYAGGPLQTGELLVARMSDNGTLDPGYGAGGLARIPFAELASLTITSIHLASDGSVLATGQAVYIDTTIVNAFFATRVSPAGTLDTSFGVNGRMLVPDTDLKPTRILARASGGYLAAGYVQRCSDPESCSIQVVAFDASGTVDTDFATNGVATVEATSYPAWVGLLEDSQGRVLLAGATASNQRERLTVWRLTSSGEIDSGFGASGRFTLAGEGRATSLFADGNGVLVSGWHFDADTGTDPIVLRLEP